MPTMAVRNSVDLLNSSDADDITPKHHDPLSKKFKLKLNLTPLSPAQNNTTPIRDDQDNLICDIDDVKNNHDNNYDNNNNNNDTKTVKPDRMSTDELLLPPEEHAKLQMQKSRDSLRKTTKIEEMVDDGMVIKEDVEEDVDVVCDIGKGGVGVPLNLNMNNMLSPPQVVVEVSEVDTQSIERININRYGDDDGDDDDDDEEEEEEEEDEIRYDSSAETMEELSDDIMIEHNRKGLNWGIFPMFASKLGIIGDLCVALILLFDHPYLFILRTCIFGFYFCIMMYVSAHHFVQFIRSFMERHKSYFENERREQLLMQQNLSNDGHANISSHTSYREDDKENVKHGSTHNLQKQSSFHREDGRRPSDAIDIRNIHPINIHQPQISKQIKSIVFDPIINNCISIPSVIDQGVNNNNNNNTNLMATMADNNINIIQQEPWDTDNVPTAFPLPTKKDIEFRTGSDEIKKLVRNMLNDNINDKLNYETQEKLRNILEILQDINIMEKGNIEEKIEYDDELDPEAKRWLAQTVLSKHSGGDNFSVGQTPHFDFNNLHSATAASVINHTLSNHTDITDKNAIITPMASHDFDTRSAKSQISPENKQKLSVLMPSPQVNDGSNDIIIQVKSDIINEDKEENYLIEDNEIVDNNDKKDETKDEDKIDINKICMENMNDLKHLKHCLIHISDGIDKITSKIMNCDGTLDTMELNELTGKPLLHSSMCIFLKFGFHDKLNISTYKFFKFIDKIELSYHSDNPYHNKMHATEVMMATMMFLDCLETTIKTMMSPQQIFSAFLSAIIHDVDHPGNNNAFEINTESDKSILYSDQSVLEFHHLQFAFKCLKNDQYNFTEKWEKEQKKNFRKQCVYSVLATDLSKHFDTIAHIKTLKFVKDEDLEYVFKSIIKMSDLSHVSKPLNQHKAWTKRITQEFHNQGDKEILNGLDVSPLCNKQNNKIAKGQVGFIKHLVTPLFESAQRFFTKHGKFDKIIMKQLKLNYHFWEIEARKEESISQITSIQTQTTDDGTIQSTPRTSSTLTTTIKHKNNNNKTPIKPRPQSATFGSIRKMAILTNLEGTPPPIFPSSHRSIAEFSKSGITDPFRTSQSKLMPTRSDNRRNDNRRVQRTFFSPQHMKHYSNPQRKGLIEDSGDIGKCGHNVTYNFQSYSKIAGKKRYRSSSANSLELPNVSPKTLQQFNDNNRFNDNDRNIKVNNELAMLMSPPSAGLSLPGHCQTDRSLSPRSLLRLGSHAMSPNSTKSMKVNDHNNDNQKSKTEIFKSLTPKYAKSKNNYSRMAISPNTYHIGQQSINQRPIPQKRRNKTNNTDFLRTKSSDEVKLISFDGNKIHPAQSAKYSKSSESGHTLSKSEGNIVIDSNVINDNNNNNNNNDNNDNVPLHVISPNQDKISPYSRSHDSKRLLDKNDDEYQQRIIQEDKSSSDDQHFKFETVINDENK